MTSTTAFRHVSVSAVSQPTVVPANLAVEMLQSEVTSDAPAAVRVELRWTGEGGVRLEGGPLPLELPAVDDPSSQTIALVRTGRGFDRDDSRPECWRVNKDSDEGFGYDLGLRVYDVERGDAFTCEAEVWTDHRADGCLPLGEYAFEGRIYVADWDAVAEWSFALEIAES